MKQFTTRISGIPCICKVTSYSRAIPAILSGPWEDSDPGSPSEIEFEILTTKGKRALWLERKVTEDDEDRLKEEWEVTLLEEKYFYY